MGAPGWEWVGTRVVGDAVPALFARLERDLADCTLRAAYGFAEFGGIEVPSGFTQIDRWRKAMDERPSVKSL